MALKKIPKEIKVGSRTIVVKMKPKLVSKNYRDETVPVFGYYSGHDLEIVLNSDNKPAQMVETFWHELMHALFDYIRFTNDIATEMQKTEGDLIERVYDLEERTVENFGQLFLQVIQDNKLLDIKN